MQYLIAGVVGLCSGMISGLFGVGGGIVMVPAMMFLLGVPIHKAVGTSLLIIIPTALTSSFKHYLQGNVDWRMALTFAPMAVLGGFAGAAATQYLSGETLRRAFGGFLVLVGLRLLLLK